MRVMVFVRMDEAGANSAPPTPEAFAAMDRFTEELVAAGVFVAAAGLKPTSFSKRIAVDGDSRTVMDGPFAGDQVAGFSTWEVADMDAAVALARRSPMTGKCEIEIRPFFEAADLAEFLTPEELSAPRDGARGKLGVA